MTNVPGNYDGIELNLSQITPEELMASIPPLPTGELNKLLERISVVTQSNIEASAKWTSLLMTIQTGLKLVGVTLLYRSPAGPPPSTTS